MKSKILCDRSRRCWWRALAFCCLAAVTLVTGCKDKEEPRTTSQPASVTKMAVGYVPVSTTLPNWVAKAEGLAAKNGLEVDFVRRASSDLILLALVNGEVQATSVCADEPILAKAAQGSPGFEIYLQEILTKDRLFDAIIVKKDSPIRSLADLKGKNIACFPGSQLRAYLQIILRKAGVEPDPEKIVQLAPANMLPALEAGTVDACFALEPVIAIGEAKGLTRVLAASPIVEYIGQGQPICAASYLISSKWADENPVAADAFVRSVYEAIELIEKDYGKAAKLYGEFTPIPPDIAPKVAITHFATVEKPDLRGLRRELSVLRDAGTVKGDMDVEKLIYRWRTKKAQ